MRTEVSYEVGALDSAWREAEAAWEAGGNAHVIELHGFPRNELVAPYGPEPERRYTAVAMPALSSGWGRIHAEGPTPAAALRALAALAESAS